MSQESYILMGIRWEVFVVGLPYRNPQNSRKNSSYIKICMVQNI